MVFEKVLKNKIDAKIVLLEQKEKLEFKRLDKFLTKAEFEALENADDTYCDKIKLICLRLKEKSSNLAWQKQGQTLAKKLFKIKSAAVFAEAEVAYNIALGLELGEYSFDKYFTKKKPEDFSALEKVVLVGNANKEGYKNYAGLANSIRYAKDLINEPSNFLTPEVFAKDIKRLEYLGLEVELLNEKDLQKKGFGALLSVSQGSVQTPYVAIIKWIGNKKQKEFDVALVGKGVTFDSGGISIKPSKGMGDMKQDMAGAAVVVATLKSLALQKSSKNILGAVGLVENMPSGKATRPGDIITSLSGQTIEILNTDAEGRMVLADVLYYVQKQYKVKNMVDIATLTGSVAMTFDSQYAAVLGNNQKLINELIKAGLDSGEKLWQLPIDAEYNKMMDSKMADMQNISSGKAGTITAACFLERFIQKDVIWAHLDIAGVDMTKNGASGFGVKLLNRFIS